MNLSSTIGATASRSARRASRLGRAAVLAFLFVLVTAGIAKADEPTPTSVARVSGETGSTLTLTGTWTWSRNCDSRRVGVEVDWNDSSAPGNPIGASGVDVGTPTDNTVDWNNAWCGQTGTWGPIQHTYPSSATTVRVCVVLYDVEPKDALAGKSGGHGQIAGGPNRNTDNSVDKSGNCLLSPEFDVRPSGGGGAGAAGGQSGAGTPCVNPTITGGVGDSLVIGTPGNDVILDLLGNNHVEGRGGNDIVCTGPGNDVVLTLGGSDVAFDQGGNNLIRTEAGRDTITTGRGNSRIAASKGADRVSAGPGKNNIRLGKGRDRATGDRGNDRVWGGRGKDTIAAGDGKNRLNGGKGNDKLRAGSGRDRMNGGRNRDTCRADGGRNRFRRCEVIRGRA